MTALQSVPKQWLQNLELMDFMNFMKFFPEKDQPHRKVWTPGKERIRTHRKDNNNHNNNNEEEEEEDSCPLVNPHS